METWESFHYCLLVEKDMNHIIAYEGKVAASLGVMLEEYVPLFAPWINRRIGIEGTLLRPPYSLTSGTDWVRGFEKSKERDEIFAVLLRDGTGGLPSYQYVGHMGVNRIQWPDGIATTGSIIGAPGTQGRGLGTEAKLLLLYHAFMVLGLRKLTSSVKAFNAQSMGHLVKCGYKQVGRYHKQHLHEGRYVDEILFEIFRGDWEPIWDRYQETGTLPKLTDEQRAHVHAETSLKNT